MFLLFFLEEKFWWVEVIFFCLNKGVEYCNWDMGLDGEIFLFLDQVKSYQIIIGIFQLELVKLRQFYF